MDHIDGGLAVGEEAFECLGQRQFGVGVFQRHRPHRGGDGDGRTRVKPREFRLEERRVAQRGGHQEEARLRQGEQRNLPRAAALAVRVVVELVHDHLAHGGVRALAERDVREDLGGAAKDGRVAVDRGVAGAEAHVVWAELAAEGEKLLVHQRLDGTGVDGALALSQRLEVQRGGDEGFAGAGGGVEDDVLLLEKFEDGRLLRGIQLQPARGDVVEEAPEQGVVAGTPIAREEVIKRGGHGGEG